MDRLRQRADFLAVANGARANSAAFVVQGRLRDDTGPIRVGFTVTKKNGTATERNRIRRRLRELVKRLDVIPMRPHHDYVLVGRRAALHRHFATMLDDLRQALLRLDRQGAKTPRASSSGRCCGRTTGRWAGWPTPSRSRRARGWASRSSPPR